MMEAQTSHSQDFQYRRQKSIDAEDDLFATLQEVQEQNKSQRQERTTKASPANRSRMRRRSSLELSGGKRTTMVATGNSSNRKERRTFSLDLNGGRRGSSVSSFGNSSNHSRRTNSTRTTMVVTGNSSSRKERRTFSLELNGGRRGSSVSSSGNSSNHSRRTNSMDINEAQRAASPGKHGTRMRRRSSIERNRGGSNSGRRERQFVNASTVDASRPASFRMRRQRRNSMSNGVSPKSFSQENLQSATSGTPVNNDVDTKPRPLRLDDRQLSGGIVRKSQSYRLGRTASTGMNDSTGAISDSLRTNIGNVGAGMKPEQLRLEDRQSSGRSVRSAHRLGRRASTGMGLEVNPVIVPKRPEQLRLEDRQSSGRSARSAHRLGRRASTGMGPEVNPVIVPKQPEQLRLEDRQSSGRSVRSAHRLGRRASTGMGLEVNPVIVPKQPEQLRLEDRQSSGRSARSAHRLGRRASTGMGPEVNPVIVPKRPDRRPNPDVAATGATLVIRSFNRRLSLCTAGSSTSTPNQTPPTKISGETKESSERFSRVDVLKDASPPKFYNSITSLASFESDDDIMGSDLEKSDSEITASTKTSERTSLSQRSENPDLHILVSQLKDPGEVERRRSERELMSQQISSRSMASQTSHHDKVAEQSSSRHLRTFLKGSKRGYGQQSNMDGDVLV